MSLWGKYPRSSDIRYNRKRQVECIKGLTKATVFFCVLIGAVVLPFYLVSLRRHAHERGDPRQESIRILEEAIEHETNARAAVVRATRQVHESYQAVHRIMEEASAATLTLTPETSELKPRKPWALQTLPFAKDHHPETSNLFNSRTIVLVICYNRKDYLRRTLENVLEVWPTDSPANRRDIGLVVTQDGFSMAVSDVVEKMLDAFEGRGVYVRHWQHERASKPAVKGSHDRYYKLCAHYIWALRKVFKEEGARRVIIVEDDMLLAPDFFEYMAATAPVLAEDDSVMAVSAWNDLGQPQFVDDPKRLFRTDFFPGLGWMMERDVFEELENKWPSVYWDDWLRSPEQRKGRQFITPEISRSYTFGKAGGASSGRTIVYRKFIDTIKLNTEAVTFTKLDLSYLIADAYKAKFQELLDKATPIQFYNLQRYSFKGVVAKIYYKDEKELARFAKIIGFFGDIKHGVQRGAYDGTVVVKQEGATIMLTPEPEASDR